MAEQALMTVSSNRTNHYKTCQPLGQGNIARHNNCIKHVFIKVDNEW